MRMKKRMRYSIKLKHKYKAGDKLLNKVDDRIYIIKEVHPAISLFWSGEIDNTEDFKELLEDILADLNDEDHPNYDFADISKYHSKYTLVHDPSWTYNSNIGTFIDEVEIEFTELELNDSFQIIYEDLDNTHQ